MKRTYKLLAIVAFMIGANASLQAQFTASATGTANTTILKPIVLTWNQPLAFGQLTASGSPGTAVIGVSSINVSSAGYIAETPITTNCIALSTSQPTVFSGNKMPGPAVFTVNGQLNFTFAISLPPATESIPVHIVNNTQAAPDMTLDNFTSVVGDPGVVAATGTLSLGTGFQFFAVGATLHIPANATPGFYQGTFIATVNYN